MQALTNGTDKTAGILFVEFISLFDSSSAATALMTGLAYGTMAVTSPFIIILIARFDTRIIGVIGGLIGGLCFILLTFSPHILYASIVYGILMGLSVTVSSLVSTVVINQWFDKRRGLANGVVSSGISIATMLLPVLLRVCIDHYGVRGALLIYSGVLLHICIGGLLLLPAEMEQEEKYLDYRNTSHEEVDAKANEKIAWQCSKCSGMDELYTQPCTCHTAVSRNELANAAAYDLLNVRLPQKSHSTNVYIPTMPVFQNDTESDQSFLRSPIESESLRRQCLRNNMGKLAISAYSLPNIDLASGNVLRHFHPDWKMWSTSKLSEDPRKDSNKYEKEVQTRDISFGALLKRCDIMTFILSINVAIVGLRNSFMFIPAYAEDWGISKLTTVYIFIGMGILEFFGRLLTGIVADTHCVRPRFLLAWYLVIIGIVGIATSFFRTFTSLIITSGTIGFFGGAYAGLFTVCIREVAGDEHFPRAVSVHYAVQGVLFTPMPSLLGLTRDLAGSSENIFRICGAIMLIASGMIAYGAYRKR